MKTISSKWPVVLLLALTVVVVVVIMYLMRSDRGWEACHNSGVCSVPVRLCNQCSRHLFNDLYNVKPKEDVCKKGFLAVVIMSHPGSLQRRRSLRPLLQDKRFHGGKKINYVFAMGSAAAGAENSRVKQESEEQDDIIQFSFLDIHHNAALLSTLAFNHVVERCKRFEQNGVDYVLKVEEDSFFNLARLVKTLERFSPEKEFIGGYCKVSKPERNINDMAFVGDDVYPMEYFPVSCSKHAYVVSYKALEYIIKIAPNVPAVHLEEVFITGLCRAAANVGFVNLDGFYWSREPSECDFDTKVIAVERLSEEDQETLVKRLLLNGRSTPWCLVRSKLTIFNIMVIVIIVFIAKLWCKYRRNFRFFNRI